MINKYIKNQRGQSIVELAIILPILLIIIMGIFEFGRVMNVYLVITNASRDGARIAAVGHSDTYITQRIQGSMSTLDSTKMSISITPSDYGRDRGEEVVVKIEYDVDLIVPIIQTIVPNPLHLVSKTSMRIE